MKNKDIYFLETFNKIFCYDGNLCITFVCVDNKWEISSIPLHEIEQMNLHEFKYLTVEEAKIKCDIKSLNILRKNIKKIYEVM